MHEFRVFEIGELMGAKAKAKTPAKARGAGRVRTKLRRMALADLEIHLGGSRVDAMRHMADRTKVDGLRSVAAVLVQSERFGTSIADALRSFAAGTRERRSSDAEEAAEKMAVKLLLPMVLFVFPAILIVTAGPAALQMADKLFLTDW